MKNFKPMLAVDCGDVNALRFPLLASPKLDGVRAIVRDGVLVSRSLKPLPNVQAQKRFANLANGLDGELIAGNPTQDPYRRTVSMVMSDDAPVPELYFHVFDHIFKPEEYFSKRYERVEQAFKTAVARMVPHTLIYDLQGLLDLEALYVGLGYEGVMLRDPNGPYKFGRSTRKEGYLLKLKRFSDSEAEVIGVVELMHNGNEAKTNALGHTERSTAKAGKTGMGVLGALQVRDVKSGVEFEIGTGFDAAEREAVWQKTFSTPGGVSFDGEQRFFTLLNPSSWPLAKYKYFPTGSKDKPRFPVFLGWRDRRDS